jgi:hypothetical protein
MLLLVFIHVIPWFDKYSITHDNYAKSIPAIRSLLGLVMANGQPSVEGPAGQFGFWHRLGNVFNLVFNRKHPSMRCFPNGTCNSHLPVPYIFNGISPSKMPIIPGPGLFLFVSEQKQSREP